MIRLIATDMDGTLLDSQKRMPGDLMRVVRALRERGVAFVVASGRQYHSLRRDFDGLADEIIYIAENGALIVEDGRQLFLDSMPAETVVDVLEKTRNLEDVYPVVCCASGALVEAGSSEAFIAGVRQYYQNTQVVPDLIKACAALDDVCKLAFFDETQAATRALPALENALSDDLEVIHSSEQWVDVMKPGIDKGRAMKMLMELKGVSPGMCMAFGDYLNDIELLEAVGESYAMANAVEEAKRVAKYIAPSNDEDGVLHVIRERFGI